MASSLLKKTIRDSWRRLRSLSKKQICPALAISEGHHHAMLSWNWGGQSPGRIVGETKAKYPVAPRDFGELGTFSRFGEDIRLADNLVDRKLEMILPETHLRCGCGY
jgi:hypothetical protein